MGRWIASRGVRPQLPTKTFNPMQAGADHGLKPERIARQVRTSLERLGVDRVDLYLAHDFDPDVPLAESLGAFDEAQAGGLIRAYGVSNFDAPQLPASLEAGPPHAIQHSYSLLPCPHATHLLPVRPAGERPGGARCAVRGRSLPWRSARARAAGSRTSPAAGSRSRPARG